MERPGASKFLPASIYVGSKTGYYFSMGDSGLGYYLDPHSKVSPDQLPSDEPFNVLSGSDAKLSVQQNRDLTLKRSRQWQTVDSDEDEAPIHHKSSHHKHHSDSDSDSDSDSSSDSSSSDDSRRDRKKRHKEKKSKHSKDKHKHHKHKKDKKDRKEKKSKKKHRHNERESSRHKAVDQNEFGKYGIIREEHFHSKIREFEVYMADVKKIPNVLNQGKREMMTYFKDFMEDYNTATMPSEKYYNLEKWEMEQYHREKQQQQRGSVKGSYETDEFIFDDERAHKAELNKIKAMKDRQEFELIRQRVAQDKNQQESMRRQEILRNELKIAHRQGDVEKVKKLENILAPDEKQQQYSRSFADDDDE